MMVAFRKGKRKGKNEIEEIRETTEHQILKPTRFSGRCTGSLCSARRAADAPKAPSRGKGEIAQGSQHWGLASSWKKSRENVIIFISKWFSLHTTHAPGENRKRPCASYRSSCSKMFLYKLFWKGRRSFQKTTAIRSIAFPDIYIYLFKKQMDVINDYSRDLSLSFTKPWRPLLAEEM